MKNYDPNIRQGLHTIKVSPRQGVYKGFVIFVKSGNCKGLNVLSIDEEDLYDMKFKENPINFRLFGEDDNGDEWFMMTLKNDKKDEPLIKDVWEELSEYIVRIEIIDFGEGRQRSEKILAPPLYIERLPSNDNQVATDMKSLLIWE